MTDSKEPGFWDCLRASDKTVLKFFLIILLIDFLYTLAFRTTDWLNETGLFIVALLRAVIETFFIVGILVLIYNYKKGIIPTKRVIIWFAKIALVIAIVSTPILYTLIEHFELIDLYDIAIDVPGIGTPDGYMLFIFLFLEVLGGTFLLMIIYLIIGFGVVGVMSVVARGVTPKIIFDIMNITSNITDDMKKRDRKRYIKYTAIRWLFDIPDALDSKGFVVTYDRGKTRPYPWFLFKRAVMWEIFFCIIVIIYISFNPFLIELEGFEPQDLVAISASISTFVPMLILPWFIYFGLDARIKGPVKDFKLYKGLRSRAIRTLVAFGTLFLFIRLATRDIDLEPLLLSFVWYFLLFFVITLVFTFIFFNYFEDGVASDIAKEYEKIKNN